MDSLKFTVRRIMEAKEFMPLHPKVADDLTNKIMEAVEAHYGVQDKYFLALNMDDFHRTRKDEEGRVINGVTLRAKFIGAKSMAMAKEIASAYPGSWAVIAKDLVDKGRVRMVLE